MIFGNNGDGPARESTTRRLNGIDYGQEVGFAPLKSGLRKCQSRTGRWRSNHEFDRDGICCFCDLGSGYRMRIKRRDHGK